MNDLTIQDQEDLRSRIFLCATNIRLRRTDLYQKNKISRSEFLAIGNFERRIRDLADDITLAILKNILTDIAAPRQKIENATQNVNDAISEIDEANKFLKLLAGVLDFFGKIVGAITTGTLPNLGALLAELQNLLNAL